MAMQSRISEHTEVDTSFRCFNQPPAKIIAAGQAPSVRTAYESGDVVLFENHGLRIAQDDLGFLQGLTFSPFDDNYVKKAKMRALTAPLAGEAYKYHPLGRLFGESQRGQAARLQKIVIDVTKQLREYVAGFFPNYRIVGDDGVTWRLTPTVSEEIHYDSYGGKDGELHYVRLFVNIDTHPRLWGIGSRVDTAMRTYRGRCLEIKQRNPKAWADPNQFTSGLNSVLPWAEVPRHFALLAPGALWLVNSQLVAHEIIYGRKMIACTYDVDASSMDDPAKAFPAVVRRAQRELEA